MNLTKEFQENGIVTLQNFLTESDLSNIRKELDSVEKEALEDLKVNWENQKVTFFTTLKNNEDFVTTEYFQKSAVKNHIFYENIEDKLVINRIGHALHLDPTKKNLHEIVYNNTALKEVLKAAGLVHPHCLLSVYIPKYANGYGSDVKPHQESSFAHTNPLSSKVLWIALEDATLENACMWGLKESHKLPLKYVSKVDHAKRTRVYEQLSDLEIPAFDKNDPNTAYVPLEVKAGDALLFDGNFVHCSPQNVSQQSRKAISYQFIETQNTELSAFNWVQNPVIKRIY